MNIKSNHIFSLILFFLIIKSVNGQSNDCKEPSGGCRVIREGINCNKLTPEEANSPCVQWQCCKTRKAAKKRAATKVDIPKENSKVKETKKTLNVSGSSGGDSKSNESEVENETESYGKYEIANQLRLQYEEDKKTLERMRTNGMTSTNSYNRILEQIRQYEENQGITGANSYYFNAKINEASDLAVKSISGFAGGFADGTFGAIGFRASERELVDGEFRYSLAPRIYELAIEFASDKGKPSGFYLGYGPQEKGESGNYSMMTGVDIGLLNIANIALIGVNIEVGLGNYNSGFIDITPDDEFTETTTRYIESAFYYSPGIHIKLFKYLYASYNYGYVHFGEENYERIENRGGAERSSETLESKTTSMYSALRVGLYIPF